MKLSVRLYCKGCKNDAYENGAEIALGLENDGHE